MSNKNNKENRARGTLFGFLDGTWVANRWTPKTTKYVIAVVFSSFLSITASYSSMAFQRKIEKLKKEVKELKMERISVNSTLVQNRRITVIEERVKSAELDISSPDTPPIYID
ncbi:MAG: FtsL-like putative cell division protein [Porphyromonas sp.]|nr:FtsL-like putative cell division protein [Porphyromonas sp.]